MGRAVALQSSNVVYFDQRLGAAHSNRWSKSSYKAMDCDIALPKWLLKKWTMRIHDQV